jgi:hypothetical protein
MLMRLRWQQKWTSRCDVRRATCGASHMPLQTVKECTLALLQAGCIALVDAFQFRNEYMPTGSITGMLEQVMRCACSP